MLREVIERATEHERPLLVASAQRDLAHLLALVGDVPAAKQMAQTARATFDRLGARVEIEKLDASLGDPDFRDHRASARGAHHRPRDDAQRAHPRDGAREETRP